MKKTFKPVEKRMSRRQAGLGPEEVFVEERELSAPRVRNVNAPKITAEQLRIIREITNPTTQTTSLNRPVQAEEQKEIVENVIIPALQQVPQNQEEAVNQARALELANAEIANLNAQIETARVQRRDVAVRGLTRLRNNITNAIRELPESSYLRAGNFTGGGYKRTNIIRYDKNSRNIREQFLANIDAKLASTTNPYANVTAGYIESIRTYAGLDNKYGFDGRYFHIGSYPKPIDKQQIFSLTAIVNAKILQAATAKEAKTLKFHLNVAKFLFSLNKANRYLKSILTFEAKYENMKDGKAETLQRMQGSAALYFQPKPQADLDLFTENMAIKINAGNEMSTRIKRIANNGNPAPAREIAIGAAVKDYKEGRANQSAIRKGFENSAALKEYMTTINKTDKYNERIDVINRVYPYMNGQLEVAQNNMGEFTDSLNRNPITTNRATLPPDFAQPTGQVQYELPRRNALTELVAAEYRRERA